MEGVITAVIIVLSIVGWISNAINENKQKAQRAGKQRPQNKRKLQSELESFLQEIQGDAPKQQQKAKQPQGPRRNKQARTSPAKSRQRQQQRSSSSRSEQGGHSSGRKTRESSSAGRAKRKSVFNKERSETVGSNHLGQGVKERVEKDIKSHHLKTLKSNLGEELSSNQVSTLGRSMTSQKSGKPSVSAGKRAFELLRSTESVRTAIILNEILQPPVSQRPDHL